MPAKNNLDADELTTDELDMAIGGATGGFGKSNSEEEVKRRTSGSGDGALDTSLPDTSGSTVGAKEEMQKRG